MFFSYSLFLFICWRRRNKVCWKSGSVSITAIIRSMRSWSEFSSEKSAISIVALCWRRRSISMQMFRVSTTAKPSIGSCNRSSYKRRIYHFVTQKNNNSLNIMLNITERRFFCYMQLKQAQKGHSKFCALKKQIKSLQNLKTLKYYFAESELVMSGILSCFL